MSMELHHFLVVNVSAHCDNDKHDSWIGWNEYELMSIPREPEPLWFLCCLLFSPALNTIFITTHLFFHALKSMTLHQFAEAWDLAAGLQACVIDQGKQTWSESLYCHLQSSAFPAYLPVIDAPMQNLSHFSGALNVRTRLWSYQTSLWPRFFASFLCIFSRTMFLFLLFQDAMSI